MKIQCWLKPQYHFCSKSLTHSLPFRNACCNPQSPEIGNPSDTSKQAANQQEIISIPLTERTEEEEKE